MAGEQVTCWRCGRTYWVRYGEVSECWRCREVVVGSGSGGGRCGSYWRGRGSSGLSETDKKVFLFGAVGVPIILFLWLISKVAGL